MSSCCYVLTTWTDTNAMDATGSSGTGDWTSFTQSGNLQFSTITNVNKEQLKECYGGLKLWWINIIFTLLHFEPINISVSDNHWDENILSEVPKSMFISFNRFGNRLAIFCVLIHICCSGFAHGCTTGRLLSLKLVELYCIMHVNSFFFAVAWIQLLLVYQLPFHTRQ